MGCTCSDPEPPQPIVINAGQTATEQATFNKEAALQQRALNMVDQYGPEGSLTYAPTGVETEGIPGMKVTQALSPVQQNLYDISTRLAGQYGDIGEAQMGKVASSLSAPFTTAGLGAAPSAPDFASLGAAPRAPDFASLGAPPSAPDFASLGAPPSAPDFASLGAPPNVPDFASLGVAPEVNPEVRERQLNAILERMQPQRTRDRSALETRLRNQGFIVGSEAYNSAMDEMNRRNTDFYLSADIQAGDEMARMYGLESDVRRQAISEMGQEFAMGGTARERAVSEMGQEFAMGGTARDRAVSEMGQEFTMEDIARGRAVSELGQEFTMRGTERQQAVSEMVQQYGLGTNARDRAINEILMQRNQPMSELAAFRSGTQPTAPSFVPTPQGQIAPPDYMGAAFGSANMQNMWNQNLYNQQMGSAQANRQGLYGLGGAGLMAAGMTYGGPQWTWGG